MAQQDNNLPEGTDTIIPGAMDTDTSDVTSGAKRKSRSRTPATTSRSSSSSSSGSSSSMSGIMDKVRSGTDRLSGEAAGKARDFLGQGIERSADALANVGKLVGDTASGIDERLGEEYGDYARQAASTLENTANRLAAKNPDELIDDTRNFIRKSPAIALAGAAIAGFALARLVKSGLASSEDDDSDDEGGSGRSTRKRS